MHNPWRTSTLILLTGLGTALVVSTAQLAMAGSTSHCQAGIDKLNDAKREIQKAGSGGHRTKALERIDAAIGELNAAIDNKEEGGGAPTGEAPHEKLIDGRWGVHGEKVHDKQTDLVWQRHHADKEMNLSDALDHCKSLNLDGGGFRLPSKDELLGIVVKGAAPTIQKEAFPNTPSKDFWTSSGKKGAAFQTTVDFFTGDEGSSPPAITHWVRCVRSK